MRSHYEKYHSAGLNRGLRHPVALVLFAHNLYLTTFRFTDTLPYCLFARTHTRSYFICNHLLLSSGVGCTDSRSLNFPIYFFSLTNPNNINFHVRSIVHIFGPSSRIGLSTERNTYKAIELSSVTLIVRDLRPLAS